MKRLLILLALTASTLFASIAEITALRGSGDVVRDGVIKKLSVGFKILKGDEIKTAAKSKLQILFSDKTVISLGQKSNFKVDEYIFEKNRKVANFSISKGFFKSITGEIGKISPKQFKIKTANATIGVRGTTIIAEVTPKLDIIACSKGQIVVSSAGKEVIVNAGERTIVEDMKAPKQSQKINAVLLKQLDKKSDPSTTEVNMPKTLNTKQEDVKDSKNELEKNKELEKFEPWEDNKRVNSLEDIEKIIGEKTPSYEGKVVEGQTSLGAINTDTSSVKLGFDLGSGEMSGNMKFDDSVQDYDVDVAGKLKGDGSFDFNSNNGYDGGGAGELSGDELQNANGNFGFSEEDMITKEKNKIDGKFETSRQ